MKKPKYQKTELEKRLEAEAAAARIEEREPTADQAQSAVDIADTTTEDATAAPPVDVEALLNERDALSDQLLRARAEFDNYRKRMARDAERSRQLAAESLIRDILPVVDHLELALRHADDHPGALAEGVALVLRQFQDVLGRYGLEPIDTQGQPFDPTVHEAVMQRESSDCPEGSIVEEFQRGYRLGQLVLRPAKVVVSAGTPDAPPAEEITDVAGDENGAEPAGDA